MWQPTFSDSRVWFAQKFSVTVSPRGHWSALQMHSERSSVSISVVWPSDRNHGVNDKRFAVHLRTCWGRFILGRCSAQPWPPPSFFQVCHSNQVPGAVGLVLNVPRPTNYAGLRRRGTGWGKSPSGKHEWDVSQRISVLYAEFFQRTVKSNTSVYCLISLLDVY